VIRAPGPRGLPTTARRDRDAGSANAQLTTAAHPRNWRAVVETTSAICRRGAGLVRRSIPTISRRSSRCSPRRRRGQFRL